MLSVKLLVKTLNLSDEINNYVDLVYFIMSVLTNTRIIPLRAFLSSLKSFDPCC